jgi:hypothetical protein
MKRTGAVDTCSLKNRRIKKLVLGRANNIIDLELLNMKDNVTRFVLLLSKLDIMLFTFFCYLP